MRHLRPLALLFLLVAGFYWKLTLTRQYDWLWSFDLANQVLPWFEVQARQWHEHRMPLWDPYLWAGQPLLGQAQPGAAYPLNWLLLLLPLKDGHINPLFLNWYFVAMHVLAAWFAYLLCRELGRSPPASIAGGLLFSLASYLGGTAWPQMANGAIWIPLVFLFQLRAVWGKVRTACNAALSGAFLGMSWLSGHHQVPMLATLAWAGVWLYFLARPVFRRMLVFRAAAIAAIFLFLCGALQILPASEYGHLSKRWAGAAEALTWDQPVPYYVQEQFDLKAGGLLGILLPGFHRAQFEPFVGILGVAFALLAIAACWSDRAVKLFAAVTLGGVIYALGHSSVFQGLLYGAVPWLDKARSPAAASAIFGFGFAVLAAFGIDQWLSGTPSPWTKRIQFAALALGVLIFAVFFCLVLANKLNFPDDERVMVSALVALLFAALLYGRLTPLQAGTLLLLLLLFELGNDTGFRFAPLSDAGLERDLANIRGHAKIAEFLHHQPGFQRAQVSNDVFQPNWGAYHDFEMWGGSLASVTTNLLSFEFHTVQARKLYGVAYTISPSPTPYGGDEVFNDDGMKVYRQPEAFPRAWSVHKLLRVPDMDAGNRLIVDHLPDLRAEAFLLAEPPAVETCAAPDTVALEEHRGGRLVIRAAMGCAGMVVLSDTYYPGWSVRIDNQPAPIYEVNGAMRGVLVPAGVHMLSMRYRPASTLIAGLLTLLGFAVVGGWALARAGLKPRLLLRH
jgi:hypothetical protein